MLVYGSDLEVHHIRIAMDVTSYDSANECVKRNLQYWVRALEVSTGLLAAKSSTAEVLPDMNGFAVILGEGDELSLALQLQPIFTDQVPLNYEALGNCLANWDPNAIAHLFYFARFLDAHLPLDVRWLNGYRLSEWHFQRGKGNLADNPKWRGLLSEFATELEPHLRHGQSLHGLFERTRAMAAHGLVDSRPEDERLRKPGDSIQWTFRVLEKIVIRIVNDPSVRVGNVVLQPKA